MKKKGEAIVDILVKTHEGKDLRLSDYLGKKVIVFFYPRASTPTCTTEACNLRDAYQILYGKGFEIIGVSADTEKKQANFVKKYEFPFPLVADTERKLIEEFGVWGEKKFMGRTFDGIHRATFILDETGKIEHVINKVKAKDHAKQILDLYTTTE